MVRRIRPVKYRVTKQLFKRRMQRNRNLLLLLCICTAAGCFMQHVWERPITGQSAGRQIRVYDIETDTLMQMDLETYVAGVVAAEMPASFELDALKAQAVAARTFTMHRIMHPNSKVTALHSEAQITTSPNTCQAWISDTVQRERWGSRYEQWQNKIMQAVSETAGEVLYYGEELIEPVYHASCGGGATEASEDVWGSAKPYLVSVACNHPKDKHSGERTVLSMEAVMKALDIQNTAVMTMADEKAYITATERTASDRVKTVQIGDQTIRGGVLRNALQLKSTLIDWQQNGEQIVFVTDGYGHGAGMCQYGADYYAEQGYDYRQILQHYYPGTVLQTHN